MYEEAGEENLEISAVLQRMYFLAKQIQQSVSRHEFRTLGPLAAELPKFLEKCREKGELPDDPTTLHLVAEICLLLDTSAEQVEEEMHRIQKRLQKLRRGRRLTAVVRAGRLANRPAERLRGEL